MALFGRREKSSGRILPARILDDLPRIGRESRRPPWQAEEHNTYVMAVVQAKAQLGIASDDEPANHAFMERFLTELISAAYERGDDAVVGAYVIADDWGNPRMEEVEGFPAFETRARQLLVADHPICQRRRWSPRSAG